MKNPSAKDKKLPSTADTAHFQINRLQNQLTALFLPLNMLMFTAAVLVILKEGRRIYPIIWIIVLILTYVLTKCVIKKALKPAETAMKSQEYFIASASHEIKSPLAAILSSAELLEPSPERETIFQECKRMDGLVQSMLTLASCDAGTWQMDIRESDVDMLLFEAWETFSESASKKDIRLNLEMEESYPSVQCDKGQISHALEILLDNAVSYSPVGTSVELGARVQAKHLVLYVKDHGPGIPDAEKEMVFHRFYSGDPSRTKKCHYGLGLCIAQEIMKQHCGTICLKDTPNGGCTFEIVLPVS